MKQISQQIAIALREQHDATIYLLNRVSYALYKRYVYTVVRTLDNSQGLTHNVSYSILQLMLD
ncbi:hypothetical protein [uncultured Nostoc sp.]|uniref:hypothetical protein n=1 Tax=uncultured Nostoc sp. TaxID=340711 RepID=UPI0035CA0F3C